MSIIIIRWKKNILNLFGYTYVYRDYIGGNKMAQRLYENDKTNDGNVKNRIALAVTPLIINIGQAMISSKLPTSLIIKLHCLEK